MAKTDKTSSGKKSALDNFIYDVLEKTKEVTKDLKTRSKVYEKANDMI